MSESDAFKLTTLAVVPVDVTLVDGWNIIALAAEINSQGGNVTQVFRWNAGKGAWEFYNYVIILMS